MRPISYQSVHVFTIAQTNKLEDFEIDQAGTYIYKASKVVVPK